MQFKFEQENRLRTEEDYCFNARYLLACAAHRINPTHWHDPEIKEDQRIRKFTEHPGISIIIDEKDFAEAKRKDERAYQQGVEVIAKGKTFKEISIHPKGAWWSKELRNTDEELVNKFTDNASRILPLDKVNKAVQTIFELEKLGNITELFENLRCDTSK